MCKVIFFINKTALLQTKKTFFIKKATIKILIKKPFTIKDSGGFLWSHLESNQAPTDYESVALTE